MKINNVQGIICLVIFLIFANYAWASEWIFYSDLGGRSFYDKDSIKSISTKTLTVWTKLLPAQTNIDMYREMRDDTKKLIKEGKYPFKRRQVDDDELSYQKVLMEINCNSGSYKYLKFIQYNKSDEIIYSSDDNNKEKNDPMNEVRYFNPETPGYKFYSEVCNYKIKVNKK